jgi:hypothetical protein
LLKIIVADCKSFFRGLCPLTPTMNLALQAVPQKRVWTPKNFKNIDKSNNVFKVLKILKGAELARLFPKVP